MPQDEGREPGDDLWFDFVSDTGDGFAAMCTVATMLGAPALIYSPVDRWRSLVAYTDGDLVQVNAMGMPDRDLRKIADGLRQRSVGVP